MTSLPITSLTAAICGLMLVVLAIMTGLQRTKTKTLLGNGTDDVLLRRIRTHGNFTETVPMALILMALAEYQGAGQTLVCIIAALLLCGRALHIVGILGTVMPARGLGMLMTLAAILVPAGYLASIAVR
ncbi:MAG: MAPEG family protein [Sphingobium sp.]|jgi:uncharacterized membrane protein YecN with MAPEG domain|nr:MAPEG family protein [Sphingobium sp.]MCI1272724.1 MAPEG family protein [Sphingobium sp.]MCI1755048.1 MAPEG family protein [Sphingobium sp.]MCI2053686.1 MAPEG family protein [Sphingobium sp.]